MERLPEPGSGRPGDPGPRRGGPRGAHHHLLSTSRPSTRSRPTPTRRPGWRQHWWPPVQSKNLDGVNFDFEGLGSGDRAGLTNLVTKVSAALHAADPHWQVSMAVYSSAAGDPGGFVNVRGRPGGRRILRDGLRHELRTQPSATSPLFGPAFSDVTALQQFTKVVPPSKIILGLPFYGYDGPPPTPPLRRHPPGRSRP